MTAPLADPSLQAQAEVPVRVAFITVEILMLLEAWGQWGLWARLVGVFAFAYWANELLVYRLRRWISLGAGEVVRMVCNAVVTLLAGHLTHWGLALWIYLLLLCMATGLSDIQGRKSTPLLVVGLWAAAGSAALVEGVPLLRIASLLTGSVAGFILVRASTRAITQILLRTDAQRQELLKAHLDLKAMQDMLLEQEKLAGLGMLAAGIAHEINNPMSFVSSNVSSLLREMKGLPDLPSSLSDYVTEILPDTVDGIRRVNAIVADLRRFARSEPEGLSTYDLNAEVESAARMVHNQLKYRCRLKKELGKLPPMEGHPRQISQVLVNLLMNAEQAIPGEGTITVVTRHEGDQIVLSVQDTGIGMNAEVQRRLFEPFFTTKPVGEGTGLGLSVIHGIVGAHGGRIEVESELGKGSTFTIHLPLLPPGHAVASPAPAQQELRGISAATLR